MTDGRLTALDHAFAAREQIEFARYIRNALKIESSPEQIAATASKPLPSDSRYLTIPERRRLTNAVWKDNPTDFYLSLAFAIPLNQAPAPYKVESDKGQDPNSILKYIQRREQILHGHWTYLNHDSTTEQHLNPRSKRSLELALALSTWGALRTEQQSAIEDGFALATSALRANSTMSDMLIPTPRFLQSNKSYNQTQKASFPKPNGQNRAIKDLHRNAATTLICEYIESDLLTKEIPQYTLAESFRQAEITKYAEMAAKATERFKMLPSAKNLAGSRYFNCTLNMHAANFPDTAAAGELFYRATGGNLPLLIPADQQTRNQWVQRPQRAAFAESPQRDILDTLISQYDMQPFMQKCRIYFHCWLRALIDNRLQHPEQPHIYMSYLETPKELLYLSQAYYWPGPYLDEPSEDALRRVNITTLISQCMLHAGLHYRLKNIPNNKKRRHK